MKKVKMLHLTFLFDGSALNCLLAFKPVNIKCKMKGVIIRGYDSNSNM